MAASSSPSQFASGVIRLFNTGTPINEIARLAAGSAFQSAGSTSFLGWLAGDPLFITNAHVIEDSAMLFAEYPPWKGKQLAARVIGAHRERDIALVVIPRFSDQLAQEEVEQRKRDSAPGVRTVESLEWKTNIENWAAGLVPLLISAPGARGEVVWPLQIDQTRVENTRRNLTGLACLAIGYPLSQPNQVMTEGTVSAMQSFGVSADNIRLIAQITAPINHGNSGGACVARVDGVWKWIGVPFAGIVEASSMGYAILAHEALDIAMALLLHAYKAPEIAQLFLNAEGPFLGAGLQFSRAQGDGLLVCSIDAHSPLVGVAVGHMIVGIGGAVPRTCETGLVWNLPWLPELTVSLAQVLADLPLNSNVELQLVDASGQQRTVKINWALAINLPVRELFGPLEEAAARFETIMGITLTNITMQHIKDSQFASSNPLLIRRYLTSLDARYEPCVVVSAVPDRSTELIAGLGSQQLFRVGMALIKLNNVTVQSIDDLRACLLTLATDADSASTVVFTVLAFDEATGAECLVEIAVSETIIFEGSVSFSDRTHTYLSKTMRDIANKRTLPDLDK